MTEPEITEKLKEFLEFVLEEMADSSDVDSERLEIKLDSLGLIKKVDAPKDDEYSYYLFPIWETEKGIKNAMGGAGFYEFDGGKT